MRFKAPSYLYHGTTHTQLARMKDSGFQTSDDGLYVTDVEENAWGFAEEAYRPIQKEESVLVITFDRWKLMELGQLEQDIHDYGDGEEDLQEGQWIFHGSFGPAITNIVTSDGETINMNKDQLLREKLQREIDKIVDESIQNEGIMDFLRSAAAGASKVASGAWEKAKATMAQSTAKLQQLINTKLQQVEQLKTGLGPVVSMIQAAEKQTGEKLPPNPGIQSAQAMDGMAKAALAEVQQAQAEAKQAASAQPAATPAVPAAQQQQAVQEMARVLQETARYAEMHNKKTLILKEQDETLKEDLGLTAIVGLALGAMGGLPMLFKGLTWLANKLKLPKVAAAMHHAYETVHGWEAWGIDFLVPDRLSFFIYQNFWKRGLKASTAPLDFASYSKGAEGSKKKVETYIYKIILVYFFLNGLAGALHAGASLLGVAEASATVVKGVELAGAAAEIAASATSAMGLGAKP